MPAFMRPRQMDMRKSLQARRAGTRGATLRLRSAANSAICMPTSGAFAPGTTSCHGDVQLPDIAWNAAQHAWAV